MSDSNVSKKLEVVATIKDGISIGTKNIGPILVNVVLWALTIWIPYLNVGTTIGLMVSIVSKASKGEAIPFTEIFDPKYRKYMGEFFLTSGLVSIGVCIGTAFFVIPGIVIGLAWCLSLLLVIDKGKNPTEALSLSNDCTYGNKGKMFGIYFLVGLAFYIVQLILMGIGFSARIIGFMAFIVILSALFEIFVFIGLQASVYRQLASDI
jgi:hypothetical protein